ncbi:hypothetical protein [Burkholderia alba]|uniref:hypothetical protein n=1 Tax=Burkholderia alba TaxID=2683677 RepID=UPI002B05C5C7|nr:hypothetical protein [Burkholderia alba]
MLKTLRFGGLDDDNLAELVTLVAGLHTSGLQNIRVFPRGIPPVVDGLTVQAVVEPKAFSAILSNVVLQTARVHGVIVFPYGIPNVEMVGVTVELGATNQQANALEG